MDGNIIEEEGCISEQGAGHFSVVQRYRQLQYTGPGTANRKTGRTVIPRNLHDIPGELPSRPQEGIERHTDVTKMIREGIRSHLQDDLYGHKNIVSIIFPRDPKTPL